MNEGSKIDFQFCIVKSIFGYRVKNNNATQHRDKNGHLIVYGIPLTNDYIPLNILNFYNYLGSEGGRFDFEMLRKMNGQFCGALIYRGEIFIFTDRNNLENIYFTVKENKLYCASSLLLLAQETRQSTYDIDYVSWQEKILLGTVFGHRSYLKNVFSLSHGSYAKISLSTSDISIRSYDSLKKCNPNVTLQQKAKRIADALTNAIHLIAKNYLRSKTVNIALSGGLDSRLILAAAINANLTPKLFCYGNDSGVDERAIVEKVLDKLQMVAYFDSVDKNYFQTYFESSMVQTDFCSAALIWPLGNTLFREMKEPVIWGVGGGELLRYCNGTHSFFRSRLVDLVLQQKYDEARVLYLDFTSKYAHFFSDSFLEKTKGEFSTRFTIAFNEYCKQDKYMQWDVDRCFYKNISAIVHVSPKTNTILLPFLDCGVLDECNCLTVDDQLHADELYNMIFDFLNSDLHHLPSTREQEDAGCAQVRLINSKENLQYVYNEIFSSRISECSVLDIDYLKEKYTDSLANEKYQLDNYIKNIYMMTQWFNKLDFPMR